MTRSPVLSAALAVALASTPARSAEFTIDPDHSRLAVQIEHGGLVHLEGRFTRFFGFVDLDPASIGRSVVRVDFDPASFESGVAARDSMFWSPAWFDAAEHPGMTYESKGLLEIGNELQLLGKLTLRGIGRDVSCPVRLVGPRKDAAGIDRIGIEGAFAVNRRDFEMKASDRLPDGTPVFGDELRVEFAFEAATEVVPAPPVTLEPAAADGGVDLEEDGDRATTR